MQYLLYIFVIFSTISFSHSDEEDYELTVEKNYTILQDTDYESYSSSSEDSAEDTKKKERIVGGTVTDVETYPFIVSIQKKLMRNHFCGGSILSADLILSAGHCFISEQQSCCCIIAGQTNIGYSDSSTSQRINIQQFVIHPDYTDPPMNNDIACCRLESPLVFTDTVQPVNIPDTVHHGDLGEIVDNFIALGWGFTETGSSSSILRQVLLPVILNSRCQILYHDLKIHNTQVCTLHRGGGKDSCKGDSGGPVVAADNTNLQYGVVSFGVGCGKADGPGVNTRVDKYLHFIQRCLNKDDGIYNMPNPTPHSSFGNWRPGGSFMSSSNNLLPLIYLITNLMCIIYLL